MMRILLLIILFALDKPSGFATEEDAYTIYYVSTSDGNDQNDGLSPNSPKYTISSIKKKENVCIRLKCGDIFFESISGYKHSIIENYGKGENPVLCGFKILKNTDTWIPKEKGIWMLDLTEESNFIGYNGKRASNINTINNVGLIYEGIGDKVYGHLVQHKNDLTDIGDFYLTDEHSPEYFKDYKIKDIYVRMDENPSILGHLCFSMYEHGIKQMTNCIIQNLSVVGFSGHGICSCNNTEIRNCSIDLVGGAIFIKDRWWSRYGNGIEFWSDCNDNIVEGCIISRTFDCATTIQGNPTSKVIVKNIHFVGNRMYHCRQAFEHFLNDQGSEVSSYENCSFENNIAFEMGNNEFDSPEPRDCNILSYETKDKEIDIYNNVFFGGNHMYGSWHNKGKKKNTVYLYEDQYLFHTHWKTGFTPYTAGSKDSHQKHIDLTNDDSDITVLKRGSISQWFIKRKIKQQVDWKPNATLREYIMQL